MTHRRGTSPRLIGNVLQGMELLNWLSEHVCYTIDCLLPKQMLRSAAPLL